MEIHKILVVESDEGIRIDKWFQRHYRRMPFNMVAKLARQGQIRVDGKRVEASLRLMAGQEIKFPLFLQEEARSANKPAFLSAEHKKLADSIAASFLHKDEHVIVLNKPAGVAVQRGIKIQVSIDDLSSLWGFEYKEKPKLVHRLDKETSGVLVLARTTQAAQTLSIAFQKHLVVKKYLAILQGVPKMMSGRIDFPLKKGTWERENFEHVRSQKTGKNAITDYNVLDYADNTASLVELNLVTGRTHQIRAHSAAIGCPVLGDIKYNRQARSAIYGVQGEESRRINIPMSLHSAYLELELFGSKIQVHAPLPQHFKAALDHFGLTYKGSLDKTGIFHGKISASSKQYRSQNAALAQHLQGNFLIQNK